MGLGLHAASVILNGLWHTKSSEARGIFLKWTRHFQKFVLFGIVEGFQCGASVSVIFFRLC